MVSSLERLAEAVRLCKACPLGTMGRGVPGMWSDGEHSASVMILGEAPGAVEMAQGKPFVGRSGELLHSLLKEAGLTLYFISNVAKHQPPKDARGKQTEPDKVAIEACAPFLRAEFELVKPTKLILLGKTAAKLVVDGNFSMKDVVNTTREYNKDDPRPVSKGLSHPYCVARGVCFHGSLPERCDIGAGVPALILYHPAYFLRQRTAPWIQKSIREWKAAVRLFLGAKAPEYNIERVGCETHGRRG